MVRCSRVVELWHCGILRMWLVAGGWWLQVGTVTKVAWLLSPIAENLFTFIFQLPTAAIQYNESQLIAFFALCCEHLVFTSNSFSRFLKNCLLCRSVV